MSTVGTINIKDHKGRVAKVRLRSITSQQGKTAIGPSGDPVKSRMVLCATAASHPSAIGEDPAEIAHELINGDPELDLRRVGMPVKKTSRVFVTEDGTIARGISAFEVKRDPSGEEKDRRERTPSMPNINVDGAPIQLIDKQALELNDLLRKFVIRRKVQLAHTDDLSYGFLFDLARYLEVMGKAVMVGGGKRGKAPLVLRRGGLPHFAFLTGHTDGDSYCITLHLSNQELKAPEED